MGLGCPPLFLPFFSGMQSFFVATEQFSVQNVRMQEQNAESKVGLLKKIGLMDEKFTKMANKLVFRVFLPCMLFLNVYKINALSDIDLGYIIYTLISLVVLFTISLPAIMAVTKNHGRRGAIVYGNVPVYVECIPRR
jgi:hypothetical protein